MSELPPCVVARPRTHTHTHTRTRAHTHVQVHSCYRGVLEVFQSREEDTLCMSLLADFVAMETLGADGGLESDQVEDASG